MGHWRAGLAVQAVATRDRASYPALLTSLGFFLTARLLSAVTGGWEVL